MVQRYPDARRCNQSAIRESEGAAQHESTGRAIADERALPRFPTVPPRSTSGEAVPPPGACAGTLDSMLDRSVHRVIEAVADAALLDRA
ncbi:MAG: hypothetical protein QOE63_2119 [Acidimicrobiaceae bacterium]